MNKVILYLSTLLIMVSCATQEKTIHLANGKNITEKQFDRMIKKNMRHAKKIARKKVGMSIKEQKDFENSIIIQK